MTAPEHLKNSPLPISGLTVAQLYEEWQYWDWSIRTSTSWGAAVGVAFEFRKDCKSELIRRGSL